MCVCEISSRSGDHSVGLIGQHLLTFVDCVNPGGFDEVQVAVVHQRLQWKWDVQTDH